MLAVVVVLAATNVLTLVALGVVAWRRFGPAEHARPTPAVAAALDGGETSTGTRHVIGIEILNPVQLARGRGRLAGIAGSLAPGLAHRMVLDQAVVMIREAMAEQRAVADVRVHTVPGPRRRPTRQA